MTRRIELRPEAENDIETAFAWYSSERVGLALVFIGSLDRLLTRIRESPNHFPEVKPGVRRALMGRFPYGVFFKVMADQIVVFGVLHLHRSPTTWRSRT